MRRLFASFVLVNCFQLGILYSEPDTKKELFIPAVDFAMRPVVPGSNKKQTDKLSTTEDKLVFEKSGSAIFVQGPVGLGLSRDEAEIWAQNLSADVILRFSGFEWEVRRLIVPTTEGGAGKTLQEAATLAAQKMTELSTRRPQSLLEAYQKKGLDYSRFTERAQEALKESAKQKREYRGFATDYYFGGGTVEYYIFRERSEWMGKPVDFSAGLYFDRFPDSFSSRFSRRDIWGAPPFYSIFPPFP